MVHRYALLLSLVPSFAFAQSECATGRYTNYAFFDSVTVTSAVPFGSNTAVGTTTQQTLLMDVYEPFGDTLALRPVVLVGFGGSFISGTRADVAPLCDALARLGYVAIAYDYRVGLFWVNQHNTVLAVMRCVHDLRGCIRFLRKSVTEDGNPYRIDQDRIISGGVSAGAIGALHATYMDQVSEIPAVIIGDTAALGGLEGNSGSPGYSSDVLACWSMSGCLDDTSFINVGDQPLCSVHETGDNVVPCWTEEATVVGISTGLIVSGSGHIHPRMDHLGIENCLTIYPGTGHVGYLTYDTDASIDHVVQFLAHVVCDEPSGCAPLFVEVPEATASASTEPWPNPTDGLLHIELNAPGELILFDATGRDLLRVQGDPGERTLDLSPLADGPYFLRSMGPGARVWKVVKR